MIEEVKDAFKVRLEEKDWLDNITKKRCVEKVDAISEMVAYPEQIDNNTYLDDLYAQVREGGMGGGMESGRDEERDRWMEGTREGGKILHIHVHVVIEVHVHVRLPQ